MIRYLLFFVSLIFSSAQLKAGVLDYLELNKQNKSYSILPALKIYSDSLCTNEIAVEDASDLIFVRLNVLNRSQSIRWLIGFGNSNEKITLNVISNDKVIGTSYCGTDYTLVEKPVKAGVGEFVVFNLAQNDSTTLLLKVENKSKFSKYLLKYSLIEAQIVNPSTFEANRYVAKTISIFFYGAILLMIFYNLMLAITLNSRGYANYVVFSVLFLLYNFVTDGLLRESFFQDTANHFYLLRLIITPLMLLFYIQFGRIYMQTTFIVPRADRYAKYLILTLLTCYIPMVMGEWWFSRWMLLVLFIVTVVFMTVVTAKCIAKNYFPARYFLMGNIILTLTAIPYVLYLLNIIDHNEHTKIIEYLPQIGAIFDLALFSLGLANRIQVIEQELVRSEIEAEHEKQTLIEEKNLELEHKVQERTEELISQKEEIAAINEELEEKVRERTKKLQKAYRDLLNLNYELDTFIYRAAHDIRGPITTIMGLCNLALMEKDFNKCHDYLLVLDKFSKNTQFTLNRILSVNEIKNNHIKPSYFSLLKLKEGVLALLIDNPNRFKVEISFEMNEEEIIYYDYNLLQLILHNVIDNSVRFRSNDISNAPFCKVVIFTNKDNSLVVKIADNGQGIDDSIKEKIFDMFFRGNEYSSGSGLGLYIAKLASKKLSGDVYLLNSTKGNTVFEIVLAKLKERKVQFVEE
ncbi:MAG: 7TM diverse intracellular signaling domain-containing protein [Cytophagales bacterium]